MSQLRFEEFRRLPRKVQNERYKELSEHDRFLARMNDWQPPENLKPLTEEELADLPAKFQALLEKFKGK